MLTLYVGNLPWAVTEMELRDVFCPYGPVTGLRLTQDKENNRFAGFGFVELDVPPDKAQAIIKATNGAPVTDHRSNTRMIRVALATERPRAAR